MNYTFSDHDLVKPLFIPRDDKGHKGTFGHALIVSGSKGTIGATVLCTRACVHSGAGLTTVLIPECGYNILQTAIPEAMVLTDPQDDHLSTPPADIEKYSAIGIGPGMGTREDTQKLLAFFIRRYKKPMVLDADALNCLSLQPELMEALPECCILTPHPKEFDRLFGQHDTPEQRNATAFVKAKQLQCIILVKGHQTFIATPGGQGYLNTTGNSGMAKGGSGDVLTGILTALLAQGYPGLHAALLGIYLHGLAGDLAAAALSRETMTPSDLIACLAPAFRTLYP